MDHASANSNSAYSIHYFPTFWYCILLLQHPIEWDFALRTSSRVPAVSEPKKVTRKFHGLVTGRAIVARKNG